MHRKRNYAVVVGCGRLGALVANELSRRGESVVVVDIDPTAFSALEQAFGGFTIEGDATELATLREAKLDKATILVATTASDNVNLMVAQVAARVFKVPRVFARVMEPRRELSFKDVGVMAFSPTSLAAEKMYQAIWADSGEEVRP